MRAQSKPALLGSTEAPAHRPNPTTGGPRQGRAAARPGGERLGGAEQRKAQVSEHDMAGSHTKTDWPGMFERSGREPAK